MKQNTIFSFGCSHMYGWEHQSTEDNTKPSDDVYTNLLAKHYGIKHFNFSEVGASNQSIIRQIIFAQKFEQENNLDSIYWIQWSDYRRLELPYINSKNICKNWPYVGLNKEIKNLSKNKILKKWAETLYTHIDDLALFVLSANAIIQVNSLLQAKNKKVINTFAHTWDLNCTSSNYYTKDKNFKNIDTMYTDILYNDLLIKKVEEIDSNFSNTDLLVGKSGLNFKNFDPYTKRLWELVKTYNWHYWHEEDFGFKPWTVKNGYDVYPEGHPTEKAHREAFNLILKSKILEK